MNVENLLERALKFEFLSKEEGIFLYHNASTADLAFVANELLESIPNAQISLQ